MQLRINLMRNSVASSLEALQPKTFLIACYKTSMQFCFTESRVLGEEYVL